MGLFRGINLLALVLCFVVVVFGAYVRLSNAGLGCPDWPGCYGHLTVTAAQGDTDAGTRFPSRPTVEAPKAWKEMIHRYLVGGLSTLLAAMTLLAAAGRSGSVPQRLVFALVGVVIVQIVFGALTVTMKLNPVVVTTHLMLGLSTLGLLWLAWLCGSGARGAGIAIEAPPPRRERESRSDRQAWFTAQHEQRAVAVAQPPVPWALRSAALLGLLLVVGQIFLGGWTSSNYAATACPDFPTCQGSLLPHTGLAAAFAVWHGTEANYEFGILDGAARATVHLLHRYGALLLSLVLGSIAACLLAGGRTPLWRRLGAALLAVLVLQLAIGIGMVEMHFPLWLADAHNGGAALLLLTVVALNYFAWRGSAASRPEGRA